MKHKKALIKAYINQEHLDCIMPASSYKSNYNIDASLCIYDNCFLQPFDFNRLV